MKCVNSGDALSVNANGRLQMGAIELQSGSTIQICIPVDDDGNLKWVKTRIEYSRQKQAYYFFDYPNIDPCGVIAKKV